MNRRQLLEFELSVANFVDSIEPTTVEELEKLADTLHQHVEIAIMDYADDEGWGDEYSPMY